MIKLLLPNIGDIITFNQVWQLQIEVNDDNHFPCGVITSKKKYGELRRVSAANSLTLYGTLAYPLSIGGTYVDDQMVYIVRWATINKDLAACYKYINEEWFYNNSFLVLSRA